VTTCDYFFLSFRLSQFGSDFRFAGGVRVS